MDNKNKAIIENDLILIGGGHSHLSVLKAFILNPIKGLRITLISDVYQTPYSGMLPGFIENRFTLDEILIDLYKFSSIGNFRFIKSTVKGIQGKKQLIELENRPPIHYDFLSINIGIVNDKTKIIGAEKYALTLKPISKINYSELTNKLENKTIGIIGAGPAGVEVALALKKRFVNSKIYLFCSEKGILNNFPLSAKIKVLKILKFSDINVVEKSRVKQITKNSIYTVSKTKVYIDKAILATNGISPSWLKKTDLKLSKNGFIQTNKKLQTNFNNVFASGDIINFSDKKLNKSGVYAVKSSLILEKNIRNFIQNKKLIDYKPQKSYLSLIGLSNEKALAHKFNFFLISKIALKLKNLIDLKFIKKFQIYNQISYNQFDMDCRGCAAKVNLSALKEALPNDIINPSKDAHDIDRGSYFVQSVDMINSLINDPYLLGKIAANHALSDIYAALSNPVSASIILQLPKCSQKLHSEDIKQVYLGAKFVLNKNNCKLLGGHTMLGEDDNPVVGFSVIGKKFNKEKKMINDQDKIFLTGKIGVGLIFAGIQSNILNSSYLDEVMPNLIKGNEKIGKLFAKIKPLDATDITGYGLCNHLLNLKNRNKTINGITIFKDKISIFNGVQECINNNIKSSLYEQNFNYAKNLVEFKKTEIINQVFFDPQTVGGIAFIVSKKLSENTSNILNKNKIPFQEIGFVDNSHFKIKFV